MKIRNGFVSNSSSSSFVIIGRKTDLTKEDLLKIIYEKCPDLWKKHCEYYNVTKEDELDYVDDFYYEYDGEIDFGVIITESHGTFIGDLIAKCSNENELDDIVIDYKNLKPEDKIYIFTDMS